MSILIKGMEMPKSCQSCFANELQTCIFVDKNASVNGKLPDCPLVPVPPHGDLIDRDALLDTATIHWSQTTNESCFPIDEIEYAPTVIPAEGGET